MDEVCASMSSNPAKRDVLRLGNLWRMGVVWTLCLIYSHICLFFLRLRASPNSQPLQRTDFHRKPACIVTGVSYDTFSSVGLHVSLHRRQCSLHERSTVGKGSGRLALRSQFVHYCVVCHFLAEYVHSGWSDGVYD